MNKSRILLVIILLLAFTLRFYKISENPPGLYMDEAAIGVNAYQILTTGKDEHGEKTPLFFKSFGDYKMPLYIYSTSLSMSIFGKNEFAIRFPSALTGSLTVLVLYLFTKKLLELSKTNLKINKEIVALLAAFLLAISPWHLHFSRGGFETTTALFFFMMGFLLALYFLDKKKIIFLLLSSILFIGSIYAYHSYRIITPIFVFIFFGFLFLKHKKERKKIILSFILFFILFIPVLLFSFSPEGTARFSATTVFSELGNLSLTEKLIQYPLAIFKNYLSYFSFNFLFNTGDGIGRHQLYNFGPMFKWQLLFALVGIFALIKSGSRLLMLTIFGLLFLAPIPASIAVPSPHTLRSFLMIIPLIFLVALGIDYFFEKNIRLKFVLIAILGIIMISELIFYSHHYFVHYPKVNQLDWGAGYKDAVIDYENLIKSYDVAIVDKNLNYFPIYYQFYTGKKPPVMVNVDWSKPDSWKNKKVLYLRPYYGSNNDPNIVADISLPNNPNFIFAQLWKL